MINYVLISFSAVQIYDLSYIHLYTSTFPFSNNRPLSDISPVKPKCTTENEVVSSSDNDVIANFLPEVENDVKIYSCPAKDKWITQTNKQKGCCPF